tara:strand:+ start:521 stop:1708 length:1188 start_codon:yes stop_codon:yes gene_type:complete
MSTLKVDAIRHNSATSDAITTAADGTCTARITGMTGGGGLSHRNKVINGAMTVSQRATSASVSGDSNGVYKVCDRFKFRVKGGAAYTTSQSSTSPDGFSKSLKVDITTADTSLSGDDQAWVAQYIEAQNLQDLSYGTSGAQSITLSFYVRSNKTGTYFVALNQADNGYKNIGFQYTINSANTWERKSFLIPGDTSGVINDDNGTGLELYWWLAAGPTYTSGSIRSSWTTYSNGDFGAGQSINLLDSTSNEWYLTGVQLEVGDTATSYEHRSFGDELARCQRYYCKSYNYGTAPGTDTMVGSKWGRNYSADGRSANTCQVTFPVTMRDTPTVTFRGIHTGATGKWTTGSSNPNNSNTDMTVTSLYDLSENGWTSMNTADVTAEKFFGGHYEATAEL